MTTTVLDTLKQCHALVWQYRAELKDVWPTPSVEDCLLFAFCELGEAVDAYLRTKPEYARNNAKELDVLDELSDTALMLLTALGKDYVMEWRGAEKVDPVFHTWRSYIDGMERCIGYGHIDWLYTVAMLARIATHPGMDLPQRLQARLEAIKAKRQAAAYAQVLDEHEATLARARVRRGSAPWLLVGEEGA